MRVLRLWFWANLLLPCLHLQNPKIKNALIRKVKLVNFDVRKYTWCQIVTVSNCLVSNCPVSNYPVSAVSICPAVKLSWESDCPIILQSSLKGAILATLLRGLLFLYVCAQVVFLYELNIALFAFRFTFDHLGGNAIKAV